MIYFIALAIIFLLAVIVIQIGKLSDLTARIKGEEEAQYATNRTQGTALFIFMIVFLIACIWSGWHYRNYMFGYGPLKSASEHGYDVDLLFNITLVLTGIIFIITHILLFWYPLRYGGRKNQEKAYFFTDNSTLEFIWTGVPVATLIYLIIHGLIIMNNMFPTLTEEDKYIEIEATGYQFAWDIRYPGQDGKLGNRDFRLIDPASNSLGIDWRDEASTDDIVLGGTDKILLPKDSLVKVRITAKDVLHSFFLPHFRVKMDAVPGMPTSFIFRPVKTSKEFRDELKKYPEYQVPADPKEPDGPKRWESFEYELACAELCGKGHYSMRRVVEVVEREEFDAWLKAQKPFYVANVRGTANDPWAGKKLFPYEIAARREELKKEVDDYVSDITGSVSDIIILKNVFYETGAAELNSSLSKYELNTVAEIMRRYPTMKIELAGHTDNTGDATSNLELSKARANNVKEYLVSKGIDAARLTAKGYGQDQPIESNDTPEGRNKNRRTELRIISK